MQKTPLVVVVLAIAQAASAEAAENQKLGLTIYNSNLALVEDVRTMEVGAGRTRLEFKDVSGEIRPETVSLQGQGIAIVEQNFDYDLLTPQKLMEKAVGKQVQIVRINPGSGAQVTETATVLSANGGVVLKIGDRIEVLREDGVPTRVIFDKVPENLRAHPTLSVTVDSAKAGAREARLRYLTGGLSWKADYVALFDEKAGKLDLQGWVTLSNRSGTDYRDAATQLVAGDINLGDGSGGRRNIPRPGQVRSGRDSGAGAFGDYYLYPLKERTTVANNQTKQVSFLEVAGAKATKAYVYASSDLASVEQPIAVDVAVNFANSSPGGLGAQLPAGVIRDTAPAANGPTLFVGESRIGHTPQGSELSVKTGEAFDVTVQPTQVSRERLGRGGDERYRYRYAMSYRIRNARSEPVTVSVRQAGLYPMVKVVKESLAGHQIDSTQVAWEVAVPANGETILTTTLETRD